MKTNRVRIQVPLTWAGPTHLPEDAAADCYRLSCCCTSVCITCFRRCSVVRSALRGRPRFTNSLYRLTVPSGESRVADAGPRIKSSEHSFALRPQAPRLHHQRRCRHEPGRGTQVTDRQGIQKRRYSTAPFSAWRRRPRQTSGGGVGRGGGCEL